jgi:hypothetical protein
VGRGWKKRRVREKVRWRRGEEEERRGEGRTTRDEEEKRRREDGKGSWIE